MGHFPWQTVKKPEGKANHMASSAMRSGTGKYQITAITDAAGKMGAGDGWAAGPC